jgi:hypothetical protein
VARTKRIPVEQRAEAAVIAWNQIMTALREHGQGLSLPPGVQSPEEVVPSEIRHKLWLQCCFNDLSGLGQEKELTLEDPEEHYSDRVVHRPSARLQG